MPGAVSATATVRVPTQRKLAAEQAQHAQAAAQQPEGSGATAAQRGLPGFNPAASMQTGQVCMHQTDRHDSRPLACTAAA